MELLEKGKRCKDAAFQLMRKSEVEKNDALAHICEHLQKDCQAILEANQKDIEVAKEKGRTPSFIDRLALDETRLANIIEGVRQVIQLQDPCHKVLDSWSINELNFTKKSVPIGVIGIIYEARPNVSVDAATLCLKSGNACFLRGSSDTIHSNKALVQAMQNGLEAAGFNRDCIALLEDTSREMATQFMRLTKYLDLLIPRGGANLIKTTVENASVPIIETGTGNCHVYVDEYANIEDAMAIIINAKTQRVSVCNACESVLVHTNCKDAILPALIEALKQHNVRIHGCKQTCEYDQSIVYANEEDYACEYLDYEISIKVVNDIEEAINHINTYNTKHSDVIVSENETNIDFFFEAVDSACVYANASSRFSDGNEFGFGAEIGISTQKIHARGPMGLEALTSYKYLIKGNGTIRK